MRSLQSGGWLRRWRQRRTTAFEDSAEADLGPVGSVALLGLPIQLYARSRQLHDDLFREFALIASAEVDSASVPGRLLHLAERMDARYLPTRQPWAQMEEAVRQGRDEIDLRLRVPVAIADPMQQFDVLLDEADEYCRQGGLLTLSFPEDVTAFRRWFLAQHVEQLNGAAPISWNHWRTSLRDVSSA